jgi:hypothetical protein
MRGLKRCFKKFGASVLAGLFSDAAMKEHNQWHMSRCWVFPGWEGGVLLAGHLV